MKMNQKRIDIAVSIVAAILLWIYIINIGNPLSDTVVRDVPVQLEGASSLQERGYAIANTSFDSLDVYISGTRNEIKKVGSSDIVVKADVSNLSTGSSNVTLVFTAPSGVTVDSPESSTITVNVENYVTVSKPVEIIFEGAGSGQEATVISTSLSQIDVSGAESTVATVDSVRVNGTLSKAALEKPTEYTLAAKAVDESGKEVSGVALAHDTITVTAAIFPTKTVPLEVPVTGSVWTGAVVSGTEIPESIVIKGPASLLSTISQVTARSVSIEGIYETTTLPVALDLARGLYVADSSEDLKATFIIDDEGKLIYTYRARDIKINDLPAGYTATVSFGAALDRVSALVTGPVSVLRTLAAGDITPVVSARNSGPGEYEFVLTPAQNIAGVRIEFTPVSVMITIK
jgi:YbbR domain-containing protein